MTVRFKYINSVELDRKGRIQYIKTTPNAGNPLPSLCPPLASLTPVFNSWPVDFSLQPDSDNLGAAWTPYHSICVSRSNDSTTFVRGGLLQVGSDPVANVACGDPTDTSQDPSQNYLTAIPFTVKDQIVSAVYQSTTFHAHPNGTNIGQFALLGRFNQLGVGNRYDLNVKTYAGTYRETFNSSGVFQSARVQMFYWNNGNAGLAGPLNVPRMTAGQVFMMTMANFQFSPTIEAVCLKLYTNGVQRLAFTDAGSNRLLTGSMGVGADFQDIPDNVYLYFNNFLAQQVGPNPV